MKIEHIAIWTSDIEVMRQFYEKYFQAVSSNKYENKDKGFESYFLSFDSGARLELMKKQTANETIVKDKEHLGIAHFALSVGSETDVNRFTARLKEDGFSIIDGPRRTGDGYYESVVLDPEGNRIEITT